MLKNYLPKVLRLGFLSAMLALLVLAFAAVGVSAHVSAPAGSVHHASAASGAKVSILQKKSGYRFSVRSITVKQGENATLCNKTSISQTITYQSYQIYTIAANTCVSKQISFPAGTYVVHLLSNPNASLKIIVH